ncbi:MAG: hypothetical protein IKJ45_12175, partial [Kiritimatiellae bacterium]|nr:hypothetical protein [Kiritimatiellia bacterium]
MCKSASSQQPVSSSQYQCRREHWRWTLDIDRLHICKLSHFRTKRAGAGLILTRRGGEATGARAQTSALWHALNDFIFYDSQGAYLGLYF